MGRSAARLPKIRRVRALLLAAALGGAFSLWGCEEAPSGDLDRARLAIEEARASGAATWTPEEFAHAERMAEVGASEIKAQSERYAFSRNYGRAREILAAARQDALAARDAAQREKEHAKGDAIESLGRARTTLQGAHAALQIAPSPRDGRAELARLRSDLLSVESQFADVERLIQTEDYRAAAARAQGLAARVQSAVSRFFGTIESRGSRSGRTSSCRGCLPAREALS